jgi:hypothetical protein
MENLSGGFVISPMNAILQNITMTNNSQCTPLRFFYLTNSHFSISQHHTFICHNISLSCIHFPIIAISHLSYCITFVLPALPVINRQCRKPTYSEHQKFRIATSLPWSHFIANAYTSNPSSACNIIIVNSGQLS